jgi:acyl-CoA thioesterase
MTELSFLGIEPTHNPHRWILPVKEKICTPGDFMFGGAGLAAGIIAMEQTTDRPVVWATAQYLSFARPPSTIDLDVEVPVSGRNITQARAIAHVGDKEIITVNAALGQRRSEFDGVWAVMPEAPRPDDCEVVTDFSDQASSIHDCVDMRVAKGKFGFHDIGASSDDGRSILWCRAPGEEMSAALLAIIADFMPSGLGNVLGRRAGGNSLDNTIRIMNVTPTEWVLCDIHVHGMANGFGHGRAHLWSEDGVLLATASQSMIVRVFEEGQNPENA